MFASSKIVDTVCTPGAVWCVGATQRRAVCNEKTVRHGGFLSSAPTAIRRWFYDFMIHGAFSTLLDGRRMVSRHSLSIVHGLFVVGRNFCGRRTAREKR